MVPYHRNVYWTYGWHQIVKNSEISRWSILMAKAFDVYFDICGAQINSQVENNVFFLI